jgi:hypothetical protein
MIPQLNLCLVSHSKGNENKRPPQPRRRAAAHSRSRIARTKQSQNRRPRTRSDIGKQTDNQSNPLTSQRLIRRLATSPCASASASADAIKSARLSLPLSLSPSFPVAHRQRRNCTRGRGDRRCNR